MVKRARKNGKNDQQAGAKGSNMPAGWWPVNDGLTPHDIKVLGKILERHAACIDLFMQHLGTLAAIVARLAARMDQLEAQNGTSDFGEV